MLLIERRSERHKIQMQFLLKTLLFMLLSNSTLLFKEDGRKLHSDKYDIRFFTNYVSSVNNH